jgi:uncharacterized membrane protein
VKIKVKLILCLVWFSVSAIIAYTIAIHENFSVSFGAEYTDSLSGLVNLTVILCIVSIAMSVIAVKILIKEKKEENEQESKQESESVQISVFQSGTDD